MSRLDEKSVLRRLEEHCFADSQSRWSNNLGSDVPPDDVPAALQSRLMELERSLFAVKKEAREKEIAYEKAKAQIARIKLAIVIAALALGTAGAAWFGWTHLASSVSAANDREVNGGSR